VMMTDMAGSYHFYVVWALAAMFRTSSGFNVDMSTVSLRHGDADSMFGFTVRQHVDHDQTWSVHHCFCKRNYYQVQCVLCCIRINFNSNVCYGKSGLQANVFARQSNNAMTVNIGSYSTGRAVEPAEFTPVQE